jgi:hypothetical protein
VRLGRNNHRSIPVGYKIKTFILESHVQYAPTLDAVSYLVKFMRLLNRDSNSAFSEKAQDFPPKACSLSA